MGTSFVDLFTLSFPNSGSSSLPPLPQHGASLPALELYTEASVQKPVLHVGAALETHTHRQLHLRSELLLIMATLCQTQSLGVSSLGHAVFTPTLLTYFLLLYHGGGLNV